MVSNMASTSNECPNYVVMISAGSKYRAEQVNLDGSNDPFYRYKCTQLLCQVVGQGKMIRTILCNIDMVAKMLHVPAAYIIVWFAYQLGVNSKYSVNNPPNQRAWISGAHSAAKMAQILQDFIK